MDPPKWLRFSDWLSFKPTPSKAPAQEKFGVCLLLFVLALLFPRRFSLEAGVCLGTSLELSFHYLARLFESFVWVFGSVHVEALLKSTVAS